LRRTAIGRFTLDRAVTLEALQASGEMRALLEPVDALIAGYPRLDLDETTATAVLQGREVLVEGLPGLLRLYAGARFIGLAERREDGRLLSRRLIATGQSNGK
jgi:tRNA pseudouridine55 synthase